MSYVPLVIIYVTLTSRFLEHSLIYSVIIIMMVLTLHKGYTLETFKELNMRYDNNLEVLYSFANISINKNNILYIVIVLATLFFLKNKNLLLTNEIQYSIYLTDSAIYYTSYYFNTYYIPKKENYFPLHDNFISVIHPFLTIITYVLIIYLMYEKTHTENGRLGKKKITLTYYITIFTTLLGAIWASSTEGWGGVWIWDPTEILILLLIIFLITLIHSKKYYILGAVYSTILVLYYQLLTKLNISEGIHNFYTNDLSSSAYYLSFILCSLLLIKIPASIKKIYVKSKLNMSIVLLVTTCYALKNYNLLSTVTVIGISFFLLLLLFFYTSTSTTYNKGKELYYLVGGYIILQSEVPHATIQPGLVVVSYITLYILWKRKILAWSTINHLLHFFILLTLMLNYIDYKNWSYIEAQTIVDNIVVSQTDSYMSLQNASIAILSKQVYLRETSFFLEIVKESTENVSEKTQFHTFFTTLLDLVMITLKSTAIDSFNDTMLYNTTLLNLFNNKALLTSYWVIIFMYITIKKDTRW